MKNKMSSCEKEMYLPQELLSEILSWLDVDSLLICKTVCKKWHSLIEDHTFIVSHLMKSQGRWVFKTAMNNGPNTHDKYACLFSYHGILVEHNFNTKIYRLRNPSTEKTLELPYPGKHIISRKVDICVICSLNKLKLAVPCQYEKGKLVCKVFTVGIDVAWRDIEIPFSSDANVRVRETMILSEVFFILCLTDDGLEVLCLGMETEKILRIKVQNSFFPNQLGVEFLARRRTPALGSVVEDEVHVWMLEDHENVRWAKEKIIVPLKFVDNHRSKGKIILLNISDDGLKIDCDLTEEWLLDVPSGKIKMCYRAPQGQMFAYYHSPSLLHPEKEVKVNRHKEFF